MSRKHVDHSDIVRFAEERVNLPKDKADEYRAQARRLRERVERYLAEHPDFTLKKMLLVRQPSQGHGSCACLTTSMWPVTSAVLTRRRMSRPCSSISPNASARHFRISAQIKSNLRPTASPSHLGDRGLDVDVVPILYDGDPDWYGNVVSQDDGSFLKTNIPFHLEFIGKRKKAQETHFAQMARLLKFWTRKVKNEQEGFRFKSFMVELVLRIWPMAAPTCPTIPRRCNTFLRTSQRPIFVSVLSLMTIISPRP